MTVSTGVCFASVDLAVIAEIESNGRDEVCSYKGCSSGRGRFQISSIAFKDFAQYHPESDFRHEDMHDPAKAEIVALWLILERIPAMLRHYGLAVSTDNILASYNAGIGHVRTGRAFTFPETIKYIANYNRRVL